MFKNIFFSFILLFVYLNIASDVYCMSIDQLINAPVSDINPNGKIKDIFTFGSDYTDLQREDMLDELKGKVVIWTIPIYEISRIKEGVYRIVATGNNGLNVIVLLTAKTKDEQRLIHSLKTGNRLQIKGMLTGETTMRALEINPAIIWSDQSSSQANNSKSYNDDINHMSVILTDCKYSKKNKIQYMYAKNSEYDEIIFSWERDSNNCNNFIIGHQYLIGFNEWDTDGPDCPRASLILIRDDE